MVAAPECVTVCFETQTPLYTGGIGQMGDALYPSNLLGGLRHFSAMLANSLGVAGFEDRVWGTAGQAGQPAHAKGVALHWDFSQMGKITLPPKIEIPKSGKEQKNPSRWWFNTAYAGRFSLTLTRRALSDFDWQLVRMAVAIQTRKAMWGSKDQFGLGVVAFVDEPQAIATLVEPLKPTDVKGKTLADAQRLNLLRCAFATVQFQSAERTGARAKQLPWRTALALGLAVRATLRDALRSKEREKEKELKPLRHQMLGKLNEFGSAVNVSAAYGNPQQPEVRITVVLKPESPEARSNILKGFNAALQQQLGERLAAMPELNHYRLKTATWDYGGKYLKTSETKTEWLNQLAGVTP
ncbi:MAG: hypothetical protein WHS85_09630 [Hydrogenophilus sp.]